MDSMAACARQAAATPSLVAATPFPKKQATTHLSPAAVAKATAMAQRHGVGRPQATESSPAGTSQDHVQSQAVRRASSYAGTLLPCSFLLKLPPSFFLIMFSRFSLLSAALFAASAQAGTPTAVVPTQSAATDVPLCHTAPIGVMFDHSMPAGSWMLGARHMFQRSSGMLQGSEDITAAQVFETEAFPGHHYGAAPVGMDMNMTMLEAMWAPTDYLTLMVMTQHNSMTMTMQHGAAAGHHGEEGGHGSHGASHAGGSTHEHTVDGWGDTSLSAAVRLLRTEVHHLHLTLGISAPTGSVNRRGSDGRPVHYMMQPGSGTWDAITGLTYSGHKGGLFWGAQYLANVRLEDENDSGFRFGDVHNTTAWLGTQVNDWAAITGRINWRHEGTMRGHYNGSHNHSSPPDLTVNNGGDVLELGVGANISLGQGWRLGVEALFPVYQDVNGIQPKRDFSLNAGLQVRF